MYIKRKNCVEKERKGRERLRNREEGRRKGRQREEERGEGKGDGEESMHRMMRLISNE